MSTQLKPSLKASMKPGERGTFFVRWDRKKSCGTGNDNVCKLVTLALGVLGWGSVTWSFHFYVAVWRIQGAPPPLEVGAPSLVLNAFKVAL